MFLSDKTMRLLMELDAPTAQKVALLESMRADELAATAPRASRDPESKGAERMRRYRERRRQNGMDPNFDGGLFMERLRTRDGPLCVYCREAEGTDVDHMLPVMQGGTDELDNLALACHPCNCGKRGKALSPTGGEIASDTARAAYVRYVRERALGARTEPNSGAQPATPRAHVRVITSNLDTTGYVGGGVGEARERASDDWPAGKAADHAKLLVQVVASPRLDPSKSPGLVTTAGRLAAWQRDGASWEHDVVPVVTALCGKQRSAVSSWKFFDAAIARSIADNRAALEIPEAGVRATGPPAITDRIAAEMAEARRRVLES